MQILRKLLGPFFFVTSRAKRLRVQPYHKISFELFSGGPTKRLDIVNISLTGIGFHRNSDKSWQALGQKLTGQLMIHGQAFRTTIEIRHISQDIVGGKLISIDIALEKAIENYLINDLREWRFDPVFRREFYQLLENRKSVRKYKPEVVPKEILERVLNAAMHAPSGKNRQNWRFFVVQGRKRDEYLEYSQKSWLGVKDILKSRLKPSLYEFTERFFYTLGSAPIIVFCYSLNDEEERYHTSIGSVYMAVENMILAAVAEGLGTCPMGAPLEIKSEVDAFLKVDKIPVPEGSKLELLCAVVLGWPDHEPPKAPRQEESRVYWID